MREVRARPPIAYAAFRVKCAAFGVKCMTDFVSDDSADGAIVGCSRSLRIKKRRLKDGGGEIERVLQREIDRVHGLWRHAPFLAIDWASNAVDIMVVIEQAAAPEIAEKVVRFHFIGRVVPPVLRV